MDIKIVEGIRAATHLTGYVVVIDTFRASNTVLAILEKGANEIHIPQTLFQAKDLRDNLQSPLYFAEKEGDKLLEADYDNSPSQAYKLDLKGRITILYTSRGTKALRAPKRADQVLIASFGNARAIADYLNRISPTNLTLVSCGEAKNQRAVEDYLCAEYIKSLIKGDPIDYGSIRGQIMESSGANRLREKDKLKDLELCLRLNHSRIVPRVERSTRGVVIKSV